ncbi:MAG: hypothetical protein ACI4TK_05760 [Agathobacter sp.]
MFGGENIKIENRKHWLSDIVGAIPDNELCTVIEEINAFRMTGVLPKGAVKLRDLSRQAADICKVDYGEMMRTVEDAILFEAARRYHNQFC